MASEAAGTLRVGPEIGRECYVSPPSRPLAGPVKPRLETGEDD
jgi:hypothetical protein